MPEVKICPSDRGERKPGERHIAGQPRLSQDSGSDDTNCEDEELDNVGIRLSSRILNFLFDLLKRSEDFNSEWSKLLFSIFTHLLCNSFKFLRFNYLVQSINALGEP
jgi:hypothetical protein